MLSNKNIINGEQIVYALGVGKQVPSIVNNSAIRDIVDTCHFDRDDGTDSLAKLANENEAHEHEINVAARSFSGNIKSLMNYVFGPVQQLTKDIVDDCLLAKRNALNSRLNKLEIGVTRRKISPLTESELLGLLVEDYANRVKPRYDKSDTSLTREADQIMVQIEENDNLLGLVATDNDQLDDTIRDIITGKRNRGVTSLETTALTFLKIHGLVMGRSVIDYTDLYQSTKDFILARLIDTAISLRNRLREERNIFKEENAIVLALHEDNITVNDRLYAKWSKKFKNKNPMILALIYRDTNLNDESYFEPSAIEAKEAILAKLHGQAKTEGDIALANYVRDMRFMASIKQDFEDTYVNDTYIDTDTAQSLVLRMQAACKEFPYRSGMGIDTWAGTIASRTLAPNTDVEYLVNELNKASANYKTSTNEDKLAAKTDAMVAVVAKTMARQFKPKR